MTHSIISNAMTLPQFLVCLGTALVLGILASLVFSVGRKQTSSWRLSAALIPAIVTLVIMMVNGNIGAGLAVAGTFALVRFRSAQGTAIEIAGLFFGVAIGLACGMGYIAIAVIFFVIVAGTALLLTALHFGESSAAERELKITVPEILDYEGLFDDLFEEYTVRAELYREKTTNMGTLYELSYSVVLRPGKSTKEFLDKIRTRNGNLNVILGRASDKDML